MLKESEAVSEWLSYIEKIHTKSIDLTLDRITKVAQDLNLLSFNCPTILVGGTNGKGSCVRLLEAIYTEAGYQTGTLTSPHLHRFNERIRINAKEVDDLSLIEAFDYIEKHRGSTSLTYFEFTTLASFYVLKNHDLDVIILEIGLGGRLDAMNIIDADLAMISSIDLDHMDFLGNTRELIGFEKAGIFRPGKFALCGDLNPPACILSQAQEIGANYYHVPPMHHMPRLHHHFNLNLSVVLKAIDLLQDKLHVENQTIQQALDKVKLNGRFEIFHGRCTIILDVAHNPAACQSLSEAINKQPKWNKLYALVSLLRDKDILNSIEPFVDLVTEWHTAEVQHPRSRKVDDLHHQITAISKRECYTHASIAIGLAEILKKATESDMILIFGSFFTVAEARETIMGW